MARVTIEDVAREADVSITTVSHVFSGHRPVGEKTKKQVRAVAERLGYRPNAIARSLRLQSAQTIMIVVPDITNGFYPEYARAIQAVLRPAGFHSLLCDTNAVEAEELAAVDEAVARRLDGIVFSGFRVPFSQLTPVAADGMAVVYTGQAHDGSLVDTVRFDDHAATAEATRYVLERYGTDVALIGGDDGSPVGRDRRRGFVDACRAAGVAAEDLRIVIGGFDRASGARGMRGLVEADRVPRAVVCGNDMIAVGVIEACREAGLRVPDDVAVVGHDDVDLATVVTPRLTTVHADGQRLGAEAGRLLLSRITGEHSGPGRRVVIPHELVVRDSA